jgi:hypothetical protein
MSRWALLFALLFAAGPAAAGDECTPILLRLLANAEPFGFGPAAAMAEIFPHLRPRLKTMGYIGKGHALDLHGNLPYDKVVDYSAPSREEEKARFLETAKDFDVFLTAMDFGAADWAREAGLKVIVYDALAWYWKKPPSLAGTDLYVAQNFLGVEAKVFGSSAHGHAVLVPPIVTVPADAGGKPEDALLVNLGGLSNPFMSDVELEGYARSMMTAADRALDGAFRKATYTTSKAVAAKLEGDWHVETFSPQEVLGRLARSRLALMTSGLGNIFDGAALGKRVIWLPPANDSQGQQVKLLAREGMIDGAIDWHEILDIAPIDYFAPQEEVLRRIAWCFQELAHSPRAQERLAAKIRALHDAMEKEQGPPRLKQLADRFGSGGAAEIGRHVIDWLEANSVGR